MWTTKNCEKDNRKGLRYPSSLTDRRWSYIKALIPPPKLYLLSLKGAEVYCLYIGSTDTISIAINTIYNPSIAFLKKGNT